MWKSRTEWDTVHLIFSQSLTKVGQKTFWIEHCCQLRSCFFRGLDPTACHLDLTTTQSWWQFQEVCVCVASVCVCVSVSGSHTLNTPSNPFDSLIHRENFSPFHSSFFSFIPPCLPFLPPSSTSFSYTWQCAWVSAELANWIFYNRSKHQTTHTEKHIHIHHPLTEQAIVLNDITYAQKPLHVFLFWIWIQINATTPFYKLKERGRQGGRKSKRVESKMGQREHKKFN